MMKNNMLRKIDNSYRTIGSIIGVNSTDTYKFKVKDYEARVGDIVVITNNLPTAERGKSLKAYVWGRIISMRRWNPFYPAEVGIELSREGMSPYQTTLAHSGDQLEATVKTMGVSEYPHNGEIKIRPLVYPVQPISEVLSPPAKDLEKLFAGNINGDTPLPIGHLLNRPDVNIDISLKKIIARHCAIIAQSGAGKSVTARRVTRVLGDLGYPTIIFDNSGDYLGVYEHQSVFKKSKVKLFYPNLSSSKTDVHGLILNLFSKTGTPLTAPQLELFYNMLNSDRIEYEEGSSILSYVRDLAEEAQARSYNDGRRRSSYLAIVRGLNELARKIESMENENKSQRDNMEEYTFDKLPDPVQDPDKISNKNQISIVYLGGYDDLMQSTIVSLVLEKLFYARTKKTIYPFQVIIEEAHNFCPAPREGTRDKPSLTTIRKIATEGRKWGASLILISQKPSRLDETALSQCNTFICMRLSNPRDQDFVRRVIEQISQEDLRSLPNLGDGQCFISGQAVKFPLQVQIKFDEDLQSGYVGNEDFLREVLFTKKSDSSKKKDKTDNIIKGTFSKLKKKKS